MARVSLSNPDPEPSDDEDNTGELLYPQIVKICTPYTTSLFCPSWCHISTGNESGNILDLLSLNPALDPALNPSLTPTIVTPAVKSKPKKKRERESHVI